MLDRPRSLVILLVLAVAGCRTPLPFRNIACTEVIRPTIDFAEDGETAKTTFSVLTYNIEGLPWPARRRRAAKLHEIGRRLSDLRQSGEGPDIILFQEMFSDAAQRAVEASDYPAVITGPRRTTRPTDSTGEALPGTAKIKRGEVGLRMTGSGLAIASRFPILHSDLRAYGKKSCAGIDCLSNKGIVLARILIPGVPRPIDIYNTHLNASGASRAPKQRRDAAHERQTLEASEFIERTHDDANPVVLGGDFNMRNSDERWSHFVRYQRLALVHQVCASGLPKCDVRMSWDGDEPWMDTQDLQFFWSGESVSIRPIRVETMFDGRPSSPALSDHDGFKVTYELRWRVPAKPAIC